MQNPSHVCDLYHSSQQHRIFNPLGEARDQTHVLMDTSRIRYLWSHDGNSDILMKRKVTHEVPLIHNLSLIGFFPFPEATVLRFLPVVFKGIKVGFFFFFLVLFGPHPQHMEVSMRGVESELQLLAYTTATATPDTSLVFELHHSSLQSQMLNPLREAKNRTHILIDISWVFPYC